MDGPLSRRDIGYTIVSRFEELMRAYLATRLDSAYRNFGDAVPLGVVGKAQERANRSDWADTRDFLESVDFPDLSEIACYNDNYSICFPYDRPSKAEFQTLMSDLYNLRCKIAHIRGYFNSFDLDRLVEHSKAIANSLEQQGQEFNEFLEALASNPSEWVIPTPLGFTSEQEIEINVPNNVPTPDYEYEGGFVGREEDIKKLTNFVEGDLHRVVTIAGAGGVGKTALALRVIQQLGKSATKKFDGIIWLSAKESKLTYVGIEEFEPAVKDFEQLLSTIHEVLGWGTPDRNIERLQEDVHTLMDLYDRPVLVVLDNLETITDQRIIDWVLDAHPNVRVLITSRRGLGQVERRCDLLQLKKREAIRLFRLIARDKNLDSLASLDDNLIAAYVNKVSCYPLAIKWVVGQVALGRDINEVIDEIHETTSDISHFCFHQIYHALSPSAKKILCALSCFDESPSPGVLNFVVDVAKEDFEDSIQALINVSLIIPEQFSNEHNEASRRFGILPLTRGYVRQQLDSDPVLKRSIEDRLRAVRTTMEEAERAKSLYRYSLANLGATSEEEKIAAMLAQTAYANYHAGRYAEAFEAYKRASEIAPRFASVYRNWAVMEFEEGHFIEADHLMKKASQLSPDDPQIWLTWGKLKKRENRIKEAFEHYRKAFELAPDDPDILLNMGQAKSRLGEFEEAERLFELATQRDTQDSVRSEIIRLSSRAGNLVRWSEQLCADRQYREAEEKLHVALGYSERVNTLDEFDPKSGDLHRDILIELGHVTKKRDPLAAIDYFLRAIVDRPSRYREARDTVHASIQAANLCIDLGEIVRAKEICSPRLQKLEILKREVKLQREYLAVLDRLGVGQ